MLPWILSKRQEHKTRWSQTALVFVFFILIFAACLPGQALAQAGDTLGLQPIQNTINLGGGDIREIAGKIINVILGLLGIISFGLVLYGGFLIMTSAGNEDKVAQGKKVLTNAVVGLVIIMSTFAIVRFIFKSLADTFGTSSGVTDSDAPQPFFASYVGTGGLGSIIKDHYPRPNQVDVPRNTKIAVTFAEPILPSSLITNSNNTCWSKWGGNTPVKIAPDACMKGPDGADLAYYGDCFDPDNNGINWETDCDRVRTDAVQVFPKEQVTSTTKTLAEMSALAVYDAEGKATIFTFRPLQPLGSDSKNVWHTVKLVGGSSKNVGIKRLDGTDIFPQQFLSKFYTWNFETNTTLDLTPPHVVSTRPRAGQTIARNIIVQLSFNEAVDPSVTQGVLDTNSAFTNIIFGSKDIKGEWRISNGYRTLEFISALECGQNSCGEKMYCLPVSNCNSNDLNCEADYSALVRTAALANATENTFVAQPFTGVNDMAGNALDNGPENKPDGVLATVPGQTAKHKPQLPADFKTIGGNEKVPDNYFWSFKVKNQIDNTVPYITKVMPNLEGEGVNGKDIVQIYFSKPMWYSTISKGTGIIEYPANVTGRDGVQLEDFPYYFNMVQAPNSENTLTEILHPRDFGTGNLDLYYFPFVSSTVKAENQNCLYPGRGPVPILGDKNTSPVCTYTEGVNGAPPTMSNCAKVTFDAFTDSACVFGQDSTDQLQPDLASCLVKVKAASPWTAPPTTP